MKFKTTVVMAGILALLIVALYWSGVRRDEKKEATEAAGRFFSFSESDIAEVTITDSDKTITLQSVPNNPNTPYLITAPIETVADDGMVSSFFFQLARLKSERKIAEHPADLVPFGLDHPAQSVQIVVKGGKDLIEVGGKSITGRGIYLKVGGAVHLVESGITDYLTKSFDDFRRRELFSFFSSDVQSIQFEGGGESIMLTQKKGEWMVRRLLPKPEPPIKADTSKVVPVVSRLSALRGRSFIDENREGRLTTFGSPFFRVKIVLDMGTQEGAFYKGETGAIYVTTTTPKTPIYEVSSEDLAVIQQPMAHFVLPEKEQKVGTTRRVAPTD